MKIKKILIVTGLIILIAGTVIWAQIFLKNKKAFNLYVQKYPNELMESETAVNDLAKIIGSKNMDVVIHLYEKELRQLLNSPLGDNVHAGIFNPFQVMRVDNKSEKIDILYSVSPSPFSECFLETKVLTRKNSPIRTIAQLNNKKVALYPSDKVGFMLYPLLKREKVIFDKAIMNKSQEWINENLLNKKIDASISFQLIFNGNNRSRERFINSFNKEVKKSNVNLLALTDTKIPCKLLFVNNKVDPSLKIEFINNFSAAIENSENYLYFKDIAQSGSITKIDSQNVKRIEQSIAEMSKYSLKEFSKKIIEKDL